MSNTIDFSTEPYFDDYDVKKKFLAVLFNNKRRSVQIRELNQLQSILQNQISSFADHTFTDGARVKDGEVSYSVSTGYMKVTLDNASDYELINANLSVEGGLRATNDDGVVAEIINITNTTVDDPVTIFFNYISGSTDGETNSFSDGDNISINSGEDIALATVAVNTDGIGEGSTASVGDGIYYIKGHFVEVSRQTVLIQKFDVTPSGRIGLVADEKTVDAIDDTSLLDNANGTPNENAAGADRFVIDLILTVKDLDADGDVNETDVFASDTDDFIELLRLRGGLVEKDTRATNDYSAIQTHIAQQSYDTNGDFTIDNFDVKLREHLIDGDNDGVLTAEDGGEESKVAAILDEGKAFVGGNEIITNDSTFADIRKARDVETATNSGIRATNGMYCNLTSLVGSIPVGTQEIVQLWNETETVQVGTCRIKWVHKQISNQVGFETIAYRCYIYDVKMVAPNSFETSVGIIKKVLPDATEHNFKATVHSYLDKFKLYNKNNNHSFLPLATSNVKSLTNESGVSDILMEATRTFTALVDAGGEINLNAGSGQTFSPLSDRNYLVILGKNVSAVDDPLDGTILTPDDFVSFTISGASSNSLTIQIDDNLYANWHCKVVTSVLKTDAQPIPKILTAANLTIIENDLATVMSLPNADVFTVDSIVDIDGNDISDDFNFDNGQRDNKYELGTLTLKTGSVLPESDIFIEYTYFAHGTGDFFSVDSYTGIDYDSIPQHRFSNGTLIELRDVIDFRSRIDNDGVDYTGSGGLIVNPILPDQTVLLDYQYYLNRTDILVLKSNGEFNVIEGQPALNPIEPTVPENSMLLYKFDIPAFTFDVDDINIQAFETKRFTMEDIGKLEKRIENMEYYNAISQLEQNTSGRSIINPETLLERFKSGIIADGFTGHDVGDSEDEEYQCSIDSEKGELRPITDVNVNELVVNDVNTPSGMVAGENLITLPYSEVTYISQLENSDAVNVNPYGAVSWDGDIDLKPSSDVWFDTKKRPTLVVTGNDWRQIKRLKKGKRVVGSMYNSWRTNWIGTPKAKTTVNNNSLWKSKREGWWSGFSTISQDLIKETFSQKTQRDVRRGKTEFVSRSKIKFVGKKRLNITFVPFMRERRITFTAKGLKPSTRVYPFFDGKDVSEFCTPQVVGDGDGISVAATLGQALITDAFGKVDGTFQLPNGRTSGNPRFSAGNKIFKLTDSPTNDVTQESFSGEATYSTVGQIENRSKTIISTRRKRFRKNHPFRTRRTKIQPNLRNLKQTSRNEVFISPKKLKITRWKDPIAQSFLIDLEGGAFLSSINVWFKTKDSSLPVTLTIREMDNGLPTQNIVPFSTVTLNPEEVKLTTSESSYKNNENTNFKFPDLVYLMENTEYCIVLESNSTQYNVWTSKIGSTSRLNNRYISNNPYTGVFFKSQNSSTWSDDQNSDLMFSINRASFDTDQSYTAQFKGTDPSNAGINQTGVDNFEEVNPFKSTLDSLNVRVIQDDHGYIDGDSALINGAEDGNGISIPDGSYTVSNADNDGFDIQGVLEAGNTGVGATSTARFGGSAAQYDQYISFDSVHLNSGEVVLPETLLTWSMTSTNGESYGQDLTQNRAQVTRDVTNDRTIDLDRRMTLLSENAEGTTPSLVFNGTMSSQNENISPMIDRDRVSVTLVANRVNTYDIENIPADFIPETDATYGSAVAKYITKRIILNDPSNALKVYLDYNRPRSSEVEVYFRTSNVDDELDIGNIEWTLLDVVREVPETDDSEKFTEGEWEYEQPPSNISEFDTIQYKIVMKALDSTKIPRVKDFRGIALST